MRVRILTDGTIFEGKTPQDLVNQMKNSAPHNIRLTLNEYMEITREWMKEPEIRTDSPENFLASLEKLGYLVRE